MWIESNATIRCASARLSRPNAYHFLRNFEDFLYVSSGMQQHEIWCCGFGSEMARTDGHQLREYFGKSRVSGQVPSRAVSTARWRWRWKLMEAHANTVA